MIPGTSTALDNGMRSAEALRSQHVEVREAYLSGDQGVGAPETLAELGVAAAVRPGI